MFSIVLARGKQPWEIIRVDSKTILLSSLLLAWTLTIRLQRNETLDGRHSATNTRRRWRWFIRGTVFASSLLEALCAATNREDLQGTSCGDCFFFFSFPPFFRWPLSTWIIVSSIPVARIFEYFDRKDGDLRHLAALRSFFKWREDVLSSSFQFHRGSVR